MEQGIEEERIQIQARGGNFSSTGKLKVYLICKKGGVYKGVLQGEIERKRPLIQYILTFSKKEIENEVCGIILEDEEHKRYMATWNKETIDVDMISTEPLKEMEIQEEIEIEPKKDVYEKIQRRDLARLPRREWKLANNNFLLHGFYNYHHLLWIEEEGKLYIGVPGVNHAREVQAANAFGFTEFRTMENKEIELNEDEKNPREDFGYFCRRIKRNE